MSTAVRWPRRCASGGLSRADRPAGGCQQVVSLNGHTWPEAAASLHGTRLTAAEYFRPRPMTEPTRRTSLEDSMTAPNRKRKLDRRTVLKGAVAAAGLQLAPPFILKARGETP